MVAKKDKEALEMVMDRLSLADDDAVTDVVLNAVENEKLYHNYIDETENPFISNISLPWPYIVTESYLGKCIQVMAAVMPYVHVVEEDDDSRRRQGQWKKTQIWCFTSRNGCPFHTICTSKPSSMDCMAA